MIKSKALIIVLVFLIPYLLVYRVFFTPAPLVWGDAPYFYPENLNQLFNPPFSWDNIFDNFGRDVSFKLWLYIPTFLYGLLYKVFGFNNDILIRLIFYFPSTIFSLVGIYLLVRKFNKNIWANILGSLFYGFNTYLLLLIDGGQIGIALAFGLFPLVILSISNFLKEKNVKNFTISILFLFLIFNTDLRVALVAVLTSMLLEVASYGDLKILLNKYLLTISLVIVVLLLCGFWVWPFLNSGGVGNLQATSDEKSFVTILHSLFVYQPHFPGNEFGRTQYPPFYFFGVLALVLLPLVLSQSKQNIKLVLTFLLFVFLTKGNSDPLGFLYLNALNVLPFGSAFRDSSKFFIPLLLIASILISISTEQLFKLSNRVSYKRAIFILVYGYLLFLIYPALIGGLTGVLAGKPYPLNYQKIYQEINKEQGFFRTVWFPDKNSFALSIWNKEVISANQLYQEVPFSSMILGSYDLYNFLSNDQQSDWYSLLGIKYAFFPDNERKKTWTPKEKYERQLFLNYVDKIPGFEKLNWTGNVVGYKVSNPKPKIFSQDKVFLVLGDASIYRFWKENFEIGLSDIGFIFLEDGMLNIKDLWLLPKDSAALVAKDRSLEDLRMVVNLANFIDYKKIIQNDWGKILGNQRIQWKYELLKQGIENNDLGFGKDYFYSSIADEKIDLQYDVRQKEKYYLGFRQISATSSGGISVKVKDKTADVVANMSDNFQWQLLGPFDLSMGKVSIEFTNKRGFNAINSPILLKEKDLLDSKSKTDELVFRFQFIDIDKASNSEIFTLRGNQNFLRYQEVNPTEYRVNLDMSRGTWLIFSDRFSSGWRLDGQQSYPMYSMINGFYVGRDLSKSELTLEYYPQRQVKVGMLISVSSALILIIGWILYLKRR